MTTALRAPALEVVPGGPLTGSLAAPASKSVTNRLLVIAALAAGDSVLRAPLDSDDSRAMRGCLGALGAPVASTDGSWTVKGTGGRPRSPATTLDARLSGTTARFLTAVLTLCDDGGTLTGAVALRRRPIAPLVEALTVLGADASHAEGGLPVRLGGGGLAGGTVDVDVSASSQFASAVLLVAPYAAADVVCVLRGRSATDYIALTAELMRAWGAEVGHDGDRWRVRAGAGYRARDVEVEYDASAAIHLFGLAAGSRGAVTVTNVTARSRQPDAAATTVLIAFGCDVVTRGARVTVVGPAELRPVDVSLAGMPDQVTTFAALAALAPGTSVLRGVGVARGHETDRLDALATELGRLGVRVDAAQDTLTIHGGSARGPARLRTYDDHRLAMAFAALGTRVADVVIEDPGCVAKTYPMFWDDLGRLGGRWVVHHGRDGRPTGHGDVQEMTVVAIDGPAGSGKSTIARALADRLDVPHVDTGAFYRALTLAVLRAGADPASQDEALAVLAQTYVSRKDDRTLLNGEDVEAAIRTDHVDANVSAVASHPRVRTHMVEWQRDAVGARGAVVEGRDAATVIVPDATLKVWLTAPPVVRAARRAAQQGTAEVGGVERVTGELAARDHADRGNTYRARDAVEIDTGSSTVAEIVDRIVELLERDDRHD